MISTLQCRRKGKNSTVKISVSLSKHGHLSIQNSSFLQQKRVTYLKGGLKSLSVTYLIEAVRQKLNFEKRFGKIGSR